jgi:repressor LexA
MKGLTGAQQRVLLYIESHIRSEGSPPTRIEICKHFGWKSPNAAEHHLVALAKKKAVELIPNVSRGIRLVDPEVAVG